MRYISSRLAVLAVILLSVPALAQNQVNPASQIRWPVITGTVNPSFPTWPCTAAQYGQPYTNTAANTQWVCSSSGWVLLAGSSGGVSSVAATAPLTSTGGSNPVIAFTYTLQNIGGYNVYTAGAAFAMNISCTAAGSFELGYATTNPNVCTLGYSNGTPANGTIGDGTHTTSLTTPFTSGNLAYSYTVSTTFTGSATSTTGQSAGPVSTTLAISPCTFSGVTSNAAPGGATASGSGAGNQCASETSTLTGGGTLTSNGLGATTVGQVFTFSSPGGNDPTLLLTETGSGCNRNPFTFNGSSPVNGTTHAITSYTNILGGVQTNMCLYTFGPYSSAVTLEVAH